MLRLLKMIVPKIHLKLSIFFKCVLFFFDKNNVVLTKKYAIFSVLVSPLVAVTYFNIICIPKIFSFYMAVETTTPLKTIIGLWVPIVSFLISLLTYCLLFYKTKSFFVSLIGSPFVKCLNFIFFGVLIFITLLPFEPALYIIIFSVNIIFILASLITAKTYLSANYEFNHIDRFKLIFLNVNEFTHVVTFIDNMKIVYHIDCVFFDSFRLSLQDVDFFERNLNKKFYNFDKNDLNVVTMYALK